jgi:hypothetical protein
MNNLIHFKFYMKMAILFNAEPARLYIENWGNGTTSLFNETVTRKIYLYRLHILKTRVQI